MTSVADSNKQNLSLYFGDIHNHCDLSYGNGSLADALYNAHLQLDFTSITVHAAWPDLPTDTPELDYLVDYHREGFTKAQANWPGYLEAIERENQDGRFVTLPSFEWHSLAYGDYCIYYKDSVGCPIINAPDLPAMRAALRELDTPSFLIPHHIGYKQGARGINWGAFSDEMSPVAEIFSFHGLSESSEGAYPYLHSMGPRHEQSTAQYGWSQGHRFGVVGSTDHHNAFPGSYGYGRMGVWAESLTRDGIWNAVKQRRTYALTGDRIDLRFSLNQGFMGDICPANPERWIDVSVRAGDTIDAIEVLHNNRIIHRETPLPTIASDGRFKIYVEMGWAEQNAPFAWDVALQIENGRLYDLEPRLRGYGPTDTPDDDVFAYTTISSDTAHHIQMQTRTRRNPSLHTAATEGFCMEIEGSAETCLHVTFNGQEQSISLRDLMSGSRTFYTGGFVSPAICFHRAVPERAYQHRFAFLHREGTAGRDWYYVRVRQQNNQWAWSSPIWVEGAGI